jgi:hypothetical protein
MIKNLKTCFALAIVSISLTLVSMTPANVQGNKPLNFAIKHNGIYLCLPAIAVEAHIREHNKIEGKFTCDRLGECFEGKKNGDKCISCQ